MYREKIRTSLTKKAKVSPFVRPENNKNDSLKVIKTIGPMRLKILINFNNK